MDKRNSNQQNSDISVHILGNISTVPEISEKNKKKESTFNVLSREAYMNENGQRVENTATIKVTAYEGLAAIVERYCEKDKQVAICGKWVEGKEQSEMIATDILLLGGRKKD